MLTGRLMTASEAAAAGFINTTVAVTELEAVALRPATASATGGEFASNRPLTIQV